MKKFTLVAVVLGMALSLSANFKSPLYQVISSHPHDVKEMEPYIQSTVRQDGRLWVVHLKENTPEKIKKHFRLTDGSDIASYMAEEGSLKKAINPLIKELTLRLSEKEIKLGVEKLTNFKTRKAGTDDNKRAGALIKEELEALGLEVSEQCYRPGHCSVIADKKGQQNPDKVIMIMGHFDSVGKDFAGADDNASGTAVMLEVARILKDYDNRHTIRFFATNGEEDGLLGAEHYAAHLKKENKLKDMILSINMDMVGYNSNGIVELETDKKYEDLANWFAELAHSYTKLKSKITIGAWGSDHVPFIKGGVPSLLTIEDWSTKTPCYHMACDKPDTLNYGYATEIAKLNLAAIVTKDLE